MKGTGLQGAKWSVEKSFCVEGCVHEFVGGVIRGEYMPIGHLHNRPLFMKASSTMEGNVFMYYWENPDEPCFSGWWFGPEVGGDTVWARCDSRASWPPSTGWKVPHAEEVDTTMVLTPARQQVETEEAVQVGPAGDGATWEQSQWYQKEDASCQRGRSQQWHPQPGDSSGNQGGKAYVEWRRMLPCDPETGEPGNKDMFLQLCAELELCTYPVSLSTLKEDECKCELSLKHTEYQGALIFYKADGQISIVNTDVRKKASIWHRLAPGTLECQKRPTKRKHGR